MGQGDNFVFGYISVVRRPVRIPARLKIISGEPSDMMTGQIHFSSVTYRFWPVKC